MTEECRASNSQEPRNLEQLLGHIAESTHNHEQVSLERIVTAVGRRSFGPLVLMVGVIVMSPLSGMPGLPTTMAALIVLIAVQLLVGRHSFWLPFWILKRSVSRHRLIQVVNWLAPPARLIDRAIGPRLTFLVHASGTYAIAMIVAAIALVMPVLEIVPFLSSLAGVILTIFGLSLVAYDGVLAIIAFSLTAGLIAMAIMTLYGMV